MKQLRILSAILAALLLLSPSLARAEPEGQATSSDALSIALTSPLRYQVFQRRTRLVGTVVVRGTAAGAVRVDARIEGGSLSGSLPTRWQLVALDRKTHWFDAELATTAGGFYRVEVRATDAHKQNVTATVADVGVGEVFVISGQSNSTNYGEVPQQTQTGMVTSFDGSWWALANDPQPGTQDGSSKGSFIPAFGDALYRRYHVPIGIASVGHGSTSVRQWLPNGTPADNMPTMTRYIVRRPDGILVSDGTLFNGMMQRIHQLGPHGFRALLWHQGESDAHQPPEHEIAATTYAGMMKLLIRAARKQAGWDFPWFVAQATYHTPDDPGCPPIRDAQRSLWETGLALEGSDTDTLTSAYRQNNGKGTHFNDAGLKAHGRLWAAKVSSYLDSVLK